MSFTRYKGLTETSIRALVYILQVTFDVIYFPHYAMVLIIRNFRVTVLQLSVPKTNVKQNGV